MAEKLFVISNSHLDPVWIWRRRAGRTAWINTMHSVVRTMARHPEMKFSCSSSAQYRWIEENEPGLFRAIARLIEEGRWEIVGGWEVQSDAIIARTEPLLRQGMVGKEYFRKKFGVDVKIGYCVDSFGHSAGLPKLLNANGIHAYVAYRPMEHLLKLPLLFDWKADDGSQVRFIRILDTYNLGNVDEAFYMDRIDQHMATELKYQTMFFGVGDHGGGIYEKHLEWLRKASGKYDIVFATLQEYLDAVQDQKLPTVTGELGNVFRGCYTACHEVKREVACGLDRLLAAEKLGVPAEKLQEPWKELLFNHFHDILPGTSIMEAYRQDVFPGLGSVIHQASTLTDQALCRRAAALNTSFMKEGGLLVRNTEGHRVQAFISVTGFADPNENGVPFNTLTDEAGNAIPLQILPPPTTFGPAVVPWGDLSAVVDLPPHGEKLLALEYQNTPPLPCTGVERQKKLLQKLSFLKFYDDHGTWGFTLTKYLHSDARAVLRKTEILTDGPVCSILRAFYTLGDSEIQADLLACKDLPEIRISLRILWKEPHSCLKMAYDHDLTEFSFATGTAADSVVRFADYRKPALCISDKTGLTFGVPAMSDEVPMTDWCAVFPEKGGAGTAFFARDVHGCDHGEGGLRLTLLRAIPYADHHPFPRNEQTGCMDLGNTFIELFLYEADGLSAETLPKLAQKCLTKAEVLEVTCHEADPAAFATVPPCPVVNELPHVVTEAMRRLDNGNWEVHLMNHGSKTLLPLPDGSTKELPAHALTILQIPAEKA